MSTPEESAAHSPLDVKDASPANDDKKSCCSIYDGNNDAKGYSWLGAGRGAITMANIFLFQALLALATDAAGCELGTPCENRVYGMRPASWVSNIQTFTSIGAALTMPLFGAVVDFTDYRRAAGIFTAGVMVAIQAVQIYTVPSTWLPMLILQAVAVVFYYAQLVSLYAYLPEMKRDVGEYKMAGFTANFQLVQFASQAGFLVIIAVITFVLKNPGAVLTSQISQGINTTICLVFFSIGWFKYLGTRKAVRTLPEGHSMLLQGFKNNFKTMINVHKNFKKGLRWFFLALAFGQAAAQAITTLSSIYLADALLMGPLMVSLFFLDVLVCSLAGCPIGAIVARKTNPNISYTLSYLYIFVALGVGMLTLTADTERYWAFIWGAFVGIGLGWLYAVEPLYLSCLIPMGQECEVSGFYNFVTVILAWAPPIVFSVCTENNVPQKYSFLASVAFFLPAIGFLMCSGKWEDVLEETKNGTVEDATAVTKDEDDGEKA